MKYTTVNNFIGSLTDDQKKTLLKVHQLISDLTPSLKQKLWEQKLWGGNQVHIIGYGEYHHVYKTGREVNWFLIGLTAYKNKFSLYVNFVVDNKYIAEKYKKELGKVSVGKSCISFKKLEDINLPILKKVIMEAAKNPRLIK
jgi:hypothetical protein